MTTTTRGKCCRLVSEHAACSARSHHAPAAATASCLPASHSVYCSWSIVQHLYYVTYRTKHCGCLYKLAHHLSISVNLYWSVSKRLQCCTFSYVNFRFTGKFFPDWKLNFVNYWKMTFSAENVSRLQVGPGHAWAVQDYKFEFEYLRNLEQPSVLWLRQWSVILIRDRNRTEYVNNSNKTRSLWCWF